MFELKLRELYDFQMLHSYMKKESNILKKVKDFFRKIEHRAVTS